VRLGWQRRVSSRAKVPGYRLQNVRTDRCKRYDRHQSTGLADAIFQPKIAERTAWARGHAAGAALNEQLLEAAVAYTELLGAH
jgi:hypothetical protein